MASISTDQPTGRRRIQFFAADGQRRSIRLGKVTKKQAILIAEKVDRLNAATIAQMPVDRNTAMWVAGLDDHLHSRLVSVGLIESTRITDATTNRTLGQWLGIYLGERASEIKPESLRKLKQTEAKLIAAFGKNKALNAITTDDAAIWRNSLKEQGLSEASLKTHAGNVKTIIAEAVRRGWLKKNPFRHLKSGPTGRSYQRYVTQEEIQAVINVCPDAEWKLLFGLARYAGLRVPSETHQLTWWDIDWGRGRMTVHSPKTERFEGKASRVLPIFPELRPLLEERRGELRQSDASLVKIGGKGAVRRRVIKFWEAAEVEPWDNLWQTLRSSCEQDLAMRFPEYAVNKWLGHSREVSRRHYTHGVPDELYDRASQPERVVQNPAQFSATSGRIGSQEAKTLPPSNSGNQLDCNTLRQNARQRE